MARLKRKFAKGFTTISNTMARDMNLGGYERGLLYTMLTLPDDWTFSIMGLTKILPDGKTKISTGLKNLEKAGYLVRRRIYQNGKVKEMEYIFSDEPMEENECDNHSEDENSPPVKSKNLKPENLTLENPPTENLTSENPSNNKILNNQILNNQILNNQSINQSNASEKEKNVENSDDGQMDGYVKEKEIYTDIVKKNIDFWDFTEYIDEDEAEEIVQMIVRQICSRKPTERICGQDFPREVVKSAMLKVDIYCLENAIEQMKQAEDIRNYERYFISTLYNEVNNYHFKENAEKRCAEYQVKRDFVEIY